MIPILGYLDPQGIQSLYVYLAVSRNRGVYVFGRLMVYVYTCRYIVCMCVPICGYANVDCTRIHVFI